MPNLEYEVLEGPSGAEIHELRSRLEEFNRDFLEISDEPRFMLRVEGEDGKIGGGLLCTLVGRWAEMDYLWVAEEQRGRGLGSVLLEAAERLALGRGCEMAFLTTFSFQARPFYEGRGYRLVHTQEGYPRTSSKYFMEKALNQATAMKLSSLS